MPVQPDSITASARYSSACSPTADALTRVGGKVERHSQDAGVVVAEAEARRQDVGVGVVELDPDGAALVTNRKRCVEATMLDAQFVQQPQSRTSKVAELRMVTLAFQLGDHYDREHDVVLGETENRVGIGQ